MYAFGWAGLVMSGLSNNIFAIHLKKDRVALKLHHL